MGFIQLQPVRKSNKEAEFTYVAYAQSYRPEGSRTPRQRRIYLGKLQPDGHSVLISKKYAADTDTLVELEDLRRECHDEIRLLQWIKQACASQKKSESEPGCAEESPAQTGVPTKVDTIGQVHLLTSLCDQIGLSKAVRSCMDARDAESLLSLAMYQVCEGSPLYIAYHWVKDLPVNPMCKGFDFSSGGISRFLARIGDDENMRESFFREWISIRGKPTSLIFDTTSISSYAKDLSLVEYGYNRDKESLPQVNMTMVSERVGELPIYYRTIPGSIPDVSLLKNTANMLVDYGIHAYTCVLDRGFYSAGNIREMLKEGIHFAVGVPFSNKQAGALVQKHRALLGTTKVSMLSGGYVYRYKSDTWSIKSDENVTSLHAHVFLNPAKRADMVADMEKTILRLEEIAGKEIAEGRISQMQEAREWIETHTGMLRKCFAASETKEGLRIRRLPRAIALMTSNRGYTVILTDEKKVSGDHILEDYRSRDQIEKLFDMYKNENGQKRLRSGKDDVVLGRFFLAFVALVMRKALEIRMRKSELGKIWSTCDLLRELKNIRAVHAQSGTRFLLEITKKQREIYKKLGVTLPV